MRSSRPRGGGRSRAADHPFPLVPRDPDDLDRRHEHLRISTAYLASMTNDPRELNAAHVAAAAQTPDATEVLTSLGTYLGVPGFEPTTSGRPAEEAPPPLRKGVLPEVSPGDHDAYLEKVAGWEAFTRANADRRAREADEGGGIHSGVNGNCDANGAQQLDEASAMMKMSSSSSTALVAVSVVADVRARDHSTRHAAEKVPAMYFDPSFDLSDPAVFRAVCPDERTSPDDDRSNTSSKGGPEQRAPAPSSTLFGGATGLATQERLSQHLDKVEIKLVGEIGARSESFFEASARLHELDAIVSETCGAIRRTRRSLLEASTYATCAHESVTSLHRKRANLCELTHVFEALSSVRECREDLDVLVGAEDCGGALEVCEEIRRKVSDPTLAGLACLKDVAAHMDGVENQVVSSLVLEFTRAARVQPGSVGHPGDETGEFGTDGLSSEPHARRRVSPGDGWGPATTRAALAEVRGAARDAGMENVSSASEDEEDDASPSTRDAVGLGPSEESVAHVFDAALPPLRALIRGGAHRTGRIGDAMRAWGRDAASDARACIRRACLASLRAADAGVLGVQSVDMDGSNYSANSSTTEKATYKAMETLPAEVFAAVIRAATHALAGHFARAELVRSAAQYALGTVAKDGGENTSRGIVADDVRTQLCASLPPGERASASAAASDAVLALADASQGAMAKILASRASTNARLTLREFSKICDAAESFLAKAESLSGGRRCLSLRGPLNTQCKDFMSVRHAAYAAKLGSVLESETWTAVNPVPGEYQRILDAGFEPCVAVNSAEGGAEGGADTAVHDDDDDTAVRDALVLPGGERVVPVGASLALLKMCADHLAVARRVQSLGPVAVYKIAELLRVFNSRTSQLVLGAGSMRTAGLRSITAKHLALAQQSVRLFLEVTPAVSAALSPTLPDTRRTQLLSEFSSTVRDLEKHKTELQTKMVSIARDRLVYHSARLPTIWCSHIFTTRKASSEEGAADPESSSSEFATALGKEVGTLRRVIAGTLSNEDATCVLNEVLRVFDEGLTIALAGSKESTANEWRAKMGSPTKPKPAVPMDDAEGGVEGDADGGADTAVVHDDDGEETEETTVKSAAPSRDEVNGLIGRDGGALLGTLGTLVNGGTGGDGACGAPTLAKYLLEYRS